MDTSTRGFFEMEVGLALVIAIVPPLVVLGLQAPAGGPGVARVRVGVLPFVDATGGSAASGAGAALSRLVQTEMIRSKRLAGRAITLDSAAADEVDVEKAAALGKRNGVDAVLLGTLLDAQVEEASKGGWSPPILGSSGRLGVRSAKAKVSLQGDLIDVASGAVIGSFRSSASKTDNKFTGGIDTLLGSWDMSDAFMSSPLGKALQEAVADLVRKIDNTPITRGK